MPRWLAMVFAFLALPAWPQDEALQQMLRLETALGRIVQEQQSVYQQFQMVQELRRNEERFALLRSPIYGAAGAFPNFDDLQRQDEARVQRRNDLQAESERLYGRYRELEEQKRPLLENLALLAQQPVAPALPPAPPGLGDVPPVIAPAR